MVDLEETPNLATIGHQIQQAAMKQKLLCNFSRWRPDTSLLHPIWKRLLELNGNSQRLKATETSAKAGCSFGSEDFREKGNVV